MFLVTYRRQEGRLPLVILATLALLTQQLTSPTVATTTEVNSLAQTRRRFVPRDEFDTPPPAASINGRRFELIITPLSHRGNPVACFGSPAWEYSAESHQLFITAGGSDESLSTFPMNPRVEKKSGDIWGDKIQFFSTHCQRMTLPSYQGQNGYGARFEVERSRQIVTGIADFAASNPNWKSTFLLNVAGPEARVLIQNVRVRLIGTLADWQPNVPIACGVRHQAPTTDIPADRHFDLCLVSGRVERFEVFDMRDNKVLFSSSRHRD